jgi:hypothetical protein
MTRGKAWLYLVAGILGAALLATVPMFVQHHAALLRQDGTEDILLRLPLLAWTHAHTGWDLPTQLWWGWALAMVGGAIVVVGFEWIARRLLDPGDDSWSCITWSLRAWRGGLPWWSALAIAVALAAGILWITPDDSELPWFALAGIPIVAVLLSLPFLTWNLASLRAARPPTRWRPRWPGWPVVLAIVLAKSAGWAYGQAENALLSGSNGRTALAIDLLLWLPLLVLQVVLLLAWLDRSRWRDACSLLRSALRLRVVGPWVAFELRWLLLGGIVALPVIPLAAVLIFLVPQLQDAVGPAGFDPGWRAWVAMLRWFAAWWWLVVIAAGVVVGWFALIAPARLLVQVGATREPMDGNNAPAPVP